MLLFGLGFICGVAVVILLIVALSLIEASGAGVRGDE